MRSEVAPISAAVEGLLDEAVAQRLIRLVGATLGPVYGKNGKAGLLQKLDGYNNDARYRPWLVLVDLNGDNPCAPPARNGWLPQPAPRMCFRIAVREVEAWLLADRESIARFLRVRSALIPREPEQIEDPKRTVVGIARKSRSQSVRTDMVPRPGSVRTVGPAYTSRMIEFVLNHWHPEDAILAAPSLEGAVRCLRRIGRPSLRASP